MATVKATALRKNLFNYLDSVVINDEKILVSTKNGTAVIISEDYFKSLEESCYLCEIPGMAESVKEGLLAPAEDTVILDLDKAQE